MFANNGKWGAANIYGLYLMDYILSHVSVCKALSFRDLKSMGLESNI